MRKRLLNFIALFCLTSSIVSLFMGFVIFVIAWMRYAQFDSRAWMGFSILYGIPAGIIFGIAGWCCEDEK